MPRHGHSSRSSLYRAPFAPGGDSEIDAALAERLLAVALSKGGDYADLFFEYRAGGGLVFDEGILKSASRGVSMGLGVRVQQGDATGYAYVEELDWDAMKRAAETAAQIATRRRRRRRPSTLRARRAAAPLRARAASRSTCRASTSASSSSARAAAARAYDPRIVKVEACFAEEIREILVVTSDGTMARDVAAAHALRRARRSPRRTASGRRGSGGGGGRTTLGYFDGKSARGARARGGAAGDRDARRAARRRPGRWRSCSRPGDCGILLHEAVGHGLEADFNRKGTSNYTGQIGKPVASELCTVVDDGTLVQSRGIDQRRRRGQRAARAACSSRTACSSATCTTGSQREALRLDADAATGGARASRARRCRA